MEKGKLIPIIDDRLQRRIIKLLTYKGTQNIILTIGPFFLKLINFKNSKKFSKIYLSFTIVPINNVIM
jgi:hypothetical protein